jgi:hypothetical protein
LNLTVVADFGADALEPPDAPDAPLPPVGPDLLPPELLHAAVTARAATTRPALAIRIGVLFLERRAAPVPRNRLDMSRPPLAVTGRRAGRRISVPEAG